MPFIVYYLDDEKDLLEIFSDTFSSPDIEIVTFHEPRLFLEAVRANRPELVFLDYRLPRCTGDEIAQLLDDEIPKFLLTGEIDVDLKSNIIEIIEKPSELEKIETIIRTYQELKNARQGSCG